ncbi:glycosyltransferase [Kitasatospora sp. NPDC053057]|uniref:glycosyltransferase n=1 Tax=Kitasatospora sp. NPDC053057 TaxID=3364062 RepID=UPI0037C5F69C
MVAPDPERLTAAVLTAARTARVRLLLQSGWSGLTAEDSESVLTIGDTPHEWLFPRTATVVHHAGAGTTAATLRSGTPSVPVPALLDAPFWSARLTALGVSPGPIPLRTLTPERLASAIRHTLDGPHHRTRAQSVASAIRHTLDGPHHRTRAQSVAAALATEDGAAKVLAAVEAAANR